MSCEGQRVGEDEVEEDASEDAESKAKNEGLPKRSARATLDGTFDRQIVGDEAHQCKDCYFSHRERESCDDGDRSVEREEKRGKIYHCGIALEADEVEKWSGIGGNPLNYAVKVEQSDYK